MTKKIPDPVRLAQIARRKLTTLGIACEISADGTRVSGRLVDAGGSIRHPRTDEALVELGFYVDGHDKLRLTSPPSVVGMPSVEFYSRETHASLVAAVQTAISERVGAVDALRERLRPLRFRSIEEDHLAALHAVLDIDGLGRVSIEGTPEGVVATECRRPEGGAAVSLGRLPLDLFDITAVAEAEIAVAHAVEERLRNPVAAMQAEASTQSPGRPGEVVLQPPPADGLSLAWLLETLGPEFYAPDLTMTRGLTIDGEAATLQLRLQGRDELQARVQRGGALVWQGRVPARKLSNVQAFVAQALQNPTETQGAAPAHADAVGLIPPTPGEVWVMQVQVEKEDADEVRYVGLNSRGGRSGAPRVLPRRAFGEIFQAHGAGFRMLVRATEIREQKVVYERLDARRNPSAQPREVDLAVFLSTFVAEATLVD